MKIEMLSPIAHQYTHGLYRVPLHKDGNHYTLFVADGYKRDFDENTLPDEIKTKIAMILARDKQIAHDHELTHLGLMASVKDDALIDVGWQRSESWFIIVLPIASLMKLRGENNGADT